MSSGSFNQVYVQCPFYKEDDGRLCITCEGLGDARYLKQAYDRKAHYAKQIDVFCCEHYKNCEVYRLIMETKYDEEESYMTNDRNTILMHLKQHGSITAMEATEQYGIMRCAPRIKELRDMGIAIKTEMVSGKNRRGTVSNFAKYILEDDNDAG